MKDRPKIFIHILLIICISGCKKESMQSPAVILTAHTWFPYQQQITSDDTVSMYTSGRLVSRTVSHPDTSFLFGPCKQLTELVMKNDGTAKIKDMCATDFPVLPSAWGIQRTGKWDMLTIPSDVLSDSSTGGYTLITYLQKLNDTMFSCRYFASSTFSELHYLPNNEQSLLVHVRSDNIVITFRAK